MQLRLRAEAFLCDWDPKAYHQKDKAVRKFLATYESVASTYGDGAEQHAPTVKNVKDALQAARERMNEITLLDGVVEGGGAGRITVQNQVITMNDMSGTCLNTKTVHPVLWAQVEALLNSKK